MRSQLIRLALILAFAPLTLSEAQTTWVVDKAGGGDFTTINEAIIAATDGDVIHVLPGTYPESPTVDKNLRIIGLGAFKPAVNGTLGITSPSGAFLSGLRPFRLHALGTTGPVIVRDLEIGTIFSQTLTPCFTARVTGCADVRFENILVIGNFNDPGGCGEAAFVAENSTVHIVDSEIKGGSGGNGGGIVEDGVPAIHVRANSTAFLSGTSGHGGTGGTVFFVGVGAGAPMLVIDAGSEAVVRGNSTTLLDGGVGGTDPFGGMQGAGAPTVDGSGSLVLSGAVLDPPLLPRGLTVSEPSPAQSFARLTGDFAIGSSAQLDTYGPAAAAHWLFLSIEPATLALPAKIDGPIGLNLAGFPLKLLVRTTNGQDTPDSLVLSIPNLPDLVSLPLVMQSFAPGQSPNAAYLALDPTHLIIHPAP